MHVQIMQMGEIYATAELTLVAAAGNDPTYGLPGVCPETRPLERHEQCGSVYLLPAPYYSGLEEVAASKWASRAWTFQEFYHSRRRLIFTDHQVIFICGTTTQYEFMLPIPRAKQGNYLSSLRGWGLPLDGESERDILSKWTPGRTNLKPDKPDMRARGFCQQKALTGHECAFTATSHRQHDRSFASCTFCTTAWLLSQAMNYLESYSQRKLSYDRDALNAIVGAINPLADKAVYHIWGVPFAHPATEEGITGPESSSRVRCILCNDNLHPNGSAKIPAMTSQTADPKAAVVFPDTERIRSSHAGMCSGTRHARIALLWYHKQPCRRRRGFPSWSPLAWTWNTYWCKTLLPGPPILAHACNAAIRTETGIQTLSTFVPDHGNISRSISQCLEINLRTDGLSPVYLEESENKFCVALSLENDLTAIFQPYWDVDPFPFFLGTTKRLTGAMIYGTGVREHLEYVMILLSLGDNRYERLGIFKLPSTYGYYIDIFNDYPHTHRHRHNTYLLRKQNMQPLSYSDSEELTPVYIQSCWQHVFRDHGIVKLE
jgi:hypothetical protein